jgi:hypothetical protein
MIKQKIAAVFLLLVLTSGGCGLIEVEPAPPEEPVLKVTVIPPRTVLLDARENYGRRHIWDFGDGNPPQEGGPLVRYTYAERGRYAVVVHIENNAYHDDGPAIGNRPYPRQNVRSAYAIVDLLGAEPRAVILVFNAYWKPVGDVLSYLPTVLVGEASYDPTGEGLWYQWEVVRVDPDTLEPIPYPPHLDGYQPPIEYIRTHDMNWTVYLRGPSCAAPPWMYRIRLTVTDKYYRQHTATRYIRVW